MVVSNLNLLACEKDSNWVAIPNCGDLVLEITCMNFFITPVHGTMALMEISIGHAAASSTYNSRTFLLYTLFCEKRYMRITNPVKATSLLRK